MPDVPHGYIPLEMGTGEGGNRVTTMRDSPAMAPAGSAMEKSIDVVRRR
jgi:hypothetical protein